MNPLKAADPCKITGKKQPACLIQANVEFANTVVCSLWCVKAAIIQQAGVQEIPSWYCLRSETAMHWSESAARLHGCTEWTRPPAH